MLHPRTAKSLLTPTRLTAGGPAPENRRSPRRRGLHRRRAAERAADRLLERRGLLGRCGGGRRRAGRSLELRGLLLYGRHAAGAAHVAGARAARAPRQGGAGGGADAQHRSQNGGNVRTLNFVLISF